MGFQRLNHIRFRHANPLKVAGDKVRGEKDISKAVKSAVKAVNDATKDVYETSKSINLLEAAIFQWKNENPSYSGKEFWLKERKSLLKKQKNNQKEKKDYLELARRHLKEQEDIFLKLTGILFPRVFSSSSKPY